MTGDIALRWSADGQVTTSPPSSGGEYGGELADRVREQAAVRLAAEASTAEQAGRARLNAEGRAALCRRVIREVLDGEAARALAAGTPPLGTDAEARLERAVFDALCGLGGFQPYLDDPLVENVNANGCDQVFVRYADGRRERVPPVAASDAELEDLVRAIAARAGIEERRFDRGCPRLSVPLPDGGRLFAAMAVTARPCVAIRRDRLAAATLSDLVRNATMTGEVAGFLAAAVRARKNILISGGTAVGKTTLLRALASAIPSYERLITIEDSLELCLDRDTQAHPDVVALQAREPNVEGQGEVSLAELVRWALRMSPDRVIVGEVRGREVVPMLNAMSQGNDGSMTTLHASSSRGAFMKLAAYAAQTEEHLRLEDTNLLIAGAVHFVIQLDYAPAGQRVISSIREVVDADGRQVVSNEVYTPGPDRRAIPAAPLRATTADELAAAGNTLGEAGRL
jgi:Flp pilus assembly CpaF family ATPase